MEPLVEALIGITALVAGAALVVRAVAFLAGLL